MVEEIESSPVSRRRAEPGPSLLVFAEPLQREGLGRWLEQSPVGYRLVDETEAASASPALVIWSLISTPPADWLEREVEQLLERWQPAPLLLLLPRGHRYPQRLLLRLPLQGIVEDPDGSGLLEAVATLLQGGRVVEIGPYPAEQPSGMANEPLGFGQWLLISGLQQIDAELRVCDHLLQTTAANPLAQLLLEGRRRELRAARGLLLWLWGPLSLAWSEASGIEPPSPSSATGRSSPGGAAAATPAWWWPLRPSRPAAADPLASASAAAGGSLAAPLLASGGSGAPAAMASAGAGGSRGGVRLSLRQRSADGIWEALRERLNDAAAEGPQNGSGQLLALDGLQSDRRRDLLLALLEQFDLLRRRLQEQGVPSATVLDTWQDLQPELRRQALRRMAGSYVQIPAEGVLRPVADTLLQVGSFDLADPDLPDPTAMLTSLVEARPLLVEGRLLAPDEPQAVLYLELLLANWLVRSAELISAEVLEVAAAWPELRRYLLRPDLLATRNLERLRNQLNAQQRWTSWIARPVRLYESRRPLYRLQSGVIDTVDITEPRDQELRRLGWLQQAVTLALEARDALAPQVQNLVRSLGDLLVVLLTQVVGRAIGLVGRGIAQGMGRSLGRS
jgi:hypothetical protein